MNWYFYLLGFKKYIHIYFSPWNILQNHRDTFKVKNSILNYIVILEAEENEIIVKILIKEILFLNGDIGLFAHTCVPTNAHVSTYLE